MFGKVFAVLLKKCKCFILVHHSSSQTIFMAVAVITWRFCGIFLLLLWDEPFSPPRLSARLLPSILVRIFLIAVQYCCNNVTPFAPTALYHRQIWQPTDVCAYIDFFFSSYGIVALLAPICDGVVSYTLKNNIYAQNTDFK